MHPPKQVQLSHALADKLTHHNARLLVLMAVTPCGIQT